MSKEGLANLDLTELLDESTLNHDSAEGSTRYHRSRKAQAKEKAEATEETSNDTAENSLPHPLEIEWDRISLLCYCMSLVRQNKELSEDLLCNLQSIHQQVQTQRVTGDFWPNALEAHLAHYQIDSLTHLELDVLVCALAVEAEPRIAWQFQQLQAGGQQPFPTMSLIQELLALSSIEAGSLLQILDQKSRLRRSHLIEVDEETPFSAIKATKGLLARLLGVEVSIKPPPGAKIVSNNATWDDLVLAPKQMRILKEYVYWIKHKRLVENEWLGGKTGGPVALFCGASGTGKTFAASVIANDLGWPLYRVDLGQLVSKYIGETEKNINALFDAADGRPMVLQFDEADSLFGKRGEVKEARDRYANMEVNHLLTRIETHYGPCILTSNFEEQIDSAFMRRFQAVAEFSTPDRAARKLLWKKLLPPNAPLDKSVSVDTLAESANISGGSIRNAALHAAYMAAGEGKPICMEHLAIAVWRELNKDSHANSLNDLNELKPFLPQDF